MSKKHAQSMKHSTSNSSPKPPIARIPTPSWRNNFNKIRPDDAPTNARCRLCQKDGENFGRYFWSCKDPEYFGWADEEDDEMDTAVSTITPPTTPQKKMPPTDTKKRHRESKATVSISDSEDTKEFPGVSLPVKTIQPSVNKVLESMGRRLELLERACIKSSDDVLKFEDNALDFQATIFCATEVLKKQIDDLERDRTRLLLRIADLEENVKKFSKPMVVPPAPQPALFAPVVSATFKDALKRSRELAVEREKRIANEKKSEESLTMFLSRAHQNQNQSDAAEWIDTKLPSTTTTRTLDLTIEPDADSIDLLDEAMNDYEKGVNVFVEKKNSKGAPKSPSKKD